MSFQSVAQPEGTFDARTTRTASRANVLLWILQGLLAILFVFAGVAKLTMPIATLASVSGLPGMFMKFIAVAEVTGALGLILPRLLRLPSGLTPLAASGLVIIMIGATITTAVAQGVAPAVFPAIVGSLLALVIRGRRQRASKHGA
ncbi:MAG TPA: DoxX family protein [Bacteroidota bacterium]